MLGHSLGGQLAALFLSRHDFGIQGLILMAACSVHPSGWTGWQYWRLRLVIPSFAAISKILGYFPGDKIGFGGKAARQHLLDWCGQGRSGRYEPAGTDFNYEAALAQLRLPTLAISIQDDHLATPLAMKNLYGKFHPSAPITAIEYKRQDAGFESLNHFNWARRPSGHLPLLADWINR